MVYWWVDRLRIQYRARQFWLALGAAPSAKDLELAAKILSPALMELFLRQHPSEQFHSVCICKQLIEQGERSPDLLAAALLHDVGKSLHPLRVWERVVVVIGQVIFPGLSRWWGIGAAQGWRKPFVVAAQHPGWGAEMARAAGASPLLVKLIARHQEEVKTFSMESRGVSVEDTLLARLQKLDNES